MNLVRNANQVHEEGVGERRCSTTPPRAGTTYLTTVIAKRIAGN